ncbi:Methyltransferase type [Olea europaea subsp. europaea]|uniref:Methyltransferase type n=1 Tax=Olea europaea subsp. europaea TaxID=158383 RepID=A0A8S0UVR3_OLEEU|nr:Methyltransferase type [Olea europaea subsp. europaea]
MGSDELYTLTACGLPYQTRWLFGNGGLDFGIDQVLGTKPRGTIRIGLDIGGGIGTFAARTKERNVTIITTPMNLDGHFNSFIESWGLIPIHVSISQRLPFFAYTLLLGFNRDIAKIEWYSSALLEKPRT